MAKLTALGTGCAYAMSCFNESFLLEADGRKVLLDTGGGSEIMRRLERAHVPFPFLGIDAVFVSHYHTDHILGLPWLVSCRALAKRNGMAQEPAPLDVYLPAQAAGFARAILSYEALVAGDMSSYVTFHEVVAGDEADVAGMGARFLGSADAHSEQVGLLLEVPAADGIKTLTYCGDAPVDGKWASSLASVDILVHEAFCAEDEELYVPFAKAGGHSTVEDACRFAEDMGAGTLVLAHMRDHLGASRKQSYGQAGGRVYAGRLVVPDDMDVLEF